MPEITTRGRELRELLLKNTHHILKREEDELILDLDFVADVAELVFTTDG